MSQHFSCALPRGPLASLGYLQTTFNDIQMLEITYSGWYETFGCKCFLNVNSTPNQRPSFKFQLNPPQITYANSTARARHTQPIQPSAENMTLLAHHVSPGKKDKLKTIYMRKERLLQHERQHTNETQTSTKHRHRTQHYTRNERPTQKLQKATKRTTRLQDMTRNRVSYTSISQLCP